MPNLACSKSSCTEEAVFRPVLILAFPGSAVGYRVRLDVHVCETHRRELRRTFATPRGQLLVERALKDRSKGAPDWSRCILSFEPIQ
jgi:hypothetical protein